MYRSLVFVILVIGVVASLNEQSVSVKGKVTCNGKPAAGLKVKLLDSDTFRSDDTMAKGTTGSDGSYSLSGFASDPPGTTIDPRVQIKFKCGHLFEQCYKFKVPKTFVTSGKVATKTYDAPNVALETIKANC